LYISPTRSDIGLKRRFREVGESSRELLITNVIVANEVKGHGSAYCATAFDFPIPLVGPRLDPPRPPGVPGQCSP
jgi:hypothetical protein